MKEKITIFIFIIFCNLLNAQNTILWKITNPKSEKTSYLVGTLHQYGENFVNRFPKIEKILSNSEIALFESLTIDSLATNKLINSRTINNNLEKYFNKEQVEKLKIYTENSELNLYKLTPIELKFKLQQKYTKVVCKTVEIHEKNDHFDAYLIKLSDKHKITKKGFETLEEQIKLLNKQYQDTNWKNQKKSILFYLEHITSPKPNTNDKENLCGFSEKYRNFDLDYQFTRSANLKILVTERNNNWMNELLPQLEQKNTFIAVGFMHLMYKEGIINQLREKGFIVEPEKLN